jgi:uroporphyrinogen-III synthase
MTRVWVTRDEGDDGRMAAALRSAGLEAIVEPVLTTAIIGDAREAIARLGPDDWLVLTSPRAIAAVAAEAARVPHVAVVGERSRMEAEARGMRVALVSTTGDAQGLWHELSLRAGGAGSRICYPRSALADVPDLPGVRIEAPVIYEPHPRDFDRSVVDRVDVTCFTSASAVDAVHKALGRVPQPCASIGPRTSETICTYGARPAIETRQPTFESLAQAIAKAFNTGHDCLMPDA